MKVSKEHQKSGHYDFRIEWEEADIKYLLPNWDNRDRDSQDPWQDLYDIVGDAVYAYIGPRPEDPFFGGHRYFSDDGYDYDNSHFELINAVVQASVVGDSLTELVDWLNIWANYEYEREEKPQYMSDEQYEAGNVFWRALDSEDPTAAWAAMTYQQKNVVICQPSS